MPLPKPDWTRWRPRLGYAAFALLSFVLALRWTFPAEAVKQRLVLEAAARGFQVDAERVGPGGGLLGLTAEGVTLESGTGLKVPVDQLTASLRLLPLLTGKRSVAFDAAIYDGRVTGTADLSGDPRRLDLTATGVDLGRALPLRKALGADVLGVLDGKVDVTLPAAADGKPTGELDLVVKEAGIAGGQVPLPGMTGGLALPATKLGTVSAQVKLDQGRATFEKLEAKGGEAELTAQGLYAVLQPRLASAPLFGRAKVTARDAFWAKPQTQPLKGIAEATLASSRGKDGAWNFQVAGSVGRPSLKPVPPAD